MVQRLNDRDVYAKSLKQQEQEIIEMLEKAQQDAARAALLYPSKAPRTPPVIIEDVEEDEGAWHLPPSLGGYKRYLRRMTQYVCLLGNAHATKEEMNKMEESSGHIMVLSLIHI